MKCFAPTFVVQGYMIETHCSIRKINSIEFCHFSFSQWIIFSNHIGLSVDSHSLHDWSIARRLNQISYCI